MQIGFDVGMIETGAGALNAAPAVAVELERLAALDAYAILDTPREQDFDDVAALASAICGTPIAVVNLIGDGRQFFKAEVGLGVRETPLDSSFCARAILEEEFLLIPDATKDPRFVCNPLVTGEPHLRFYAGALLRTEQGHAIGTVCVLDYRPRELNEVQQQTLRVLARQVMKQLDLRRAVVEREAAMVVQRRREHRLDLLAKASAALIAAADPAAVLEPILTAGIAALGFDQCFIYAVDPDGRHLRLLQSVGADEATRAGLSCVDLDVPLCGIVVRTRQPFVLDAVQASTEPRYALARQVGISAFAGYPIMSRGKLVGVVSFASTREPAFNEEALTFFATLARLMSGVRERLDSEKALRESDARSRRAQEAGNVGTFEVDVETGLMSVSPEFAHLYGVPAAALYSTERFEALVVPEDRALPSTDETRRNGAAPLEVEYRIRRADDCSLRWIARRATFTRDEAGRVTRMFGTVQDITERKLAEAETRRLAAIVEQSGDFIGVTQLDGTVSWVNEAGRRLVGLADPASAKRTTIQDYFDPEQWPQIVATVFPAAEAQGQWRGELRFRHFVTGALIPVIYDVIGLRDAAGAVIAYATVTRDITEQKLAEERQRILNEELSHRLKNTLAMVLSIAGQTLRGIADRAPVEVFEQRIHALSSAHDVLLRKSWAAAAAKDVVKAVLASAGHADRIEVSGPEIDLGPRATLSLSLLLHELTTNAAKYGALSVPTGRVAVDWRLEGAGEDQEVTLNWTEEGGPPVTPPASVGRKGFGSRLIGIGLTGTGGVDLRYPPSGFQATMRAPLVQLQRS